MNFIDNYTTAELKAKEPEKEKEKTILSNDAFAIGEIIDALIKKIEHARTSLMK